MKDTLRLDRLLANAGWGTRREVKQLIKSGVVSIDGQVVKDSARQVDVNGDRVAVDGKPVHYRRYVYLMLNKPAGFVSSTDDPVSRTVLELLSPEYIRYRPFPAGRLDKDTEGLLLLTNDGRLAHDLLAPKKHVPKRYLARADRPVTDEDIRLFAAGLDLGDFVSLPAELTVPRPGNPCEVEVVIYEGKYHQVKRMFEAVGKTVLYLKRLAIGSLELDPHLAPGEYRELTTEETRLLKEGTELERLSKTMSTRLNEAKQS